MKKHDVAVIGAGAAGLTAAITASQTGKRVILIEKNSQIGRKVLATGNGRCNLTNTCTSIDRYHGATPEFIQSVISRFDQHATMEFFRDLGLVLKEEENGRIFPRTNQASSVVEVMKHRLEANRVEVLLETPVASIEASTPWKITLADGRQIHADNLIIATGGRAAHHLGSTGEGLGWANRLGHTITPTHAALVPVETIDTWPRDIQGVKVETSVRATCDGRSISESTGDLLFTSYGVSGPSVMALAGAIAPLLREYQVQLHIDLFPDMTQEELDQTLQRILHSGGKLPVKESLVGLLPGSMIPVILRFSGIGEHEHAVSISKNKRLDIVRTLKNITVTVSKLRPLKEAQVTAGGVDTREIDPQTLQSKLVKGLYFAGEILDVDGDSGGFNLQWAWSSGYVTGLLSNNPQEAK